MASAGIADVKRDQAQSKSANEGFVNNPSTFSTGEPYCGGKGVGYVSIQSNPLIESHGVLIDMWHAGLFLKSERPNLIKSVQWFTFLDGFCSELKPKLIRLNPINNNDEVDSEILRWPYIDARKKRTLRGVLILRILAQGKEIYIVEIQRRISKQIDKIDGVKKDKEEPLRGFVFNVGSHSQFHEWIHTFLSKIRFVKGQAQNLVGICPGRAATYNHVMNKNDRVSNETTLINALRKMGVEC